MMFGNVSTKQILVSYTFSIRNRRASQSGSSIVLFNEYLKLLVCVSLRLINRETVYEKLQLTQTRLCKYNLLNPINQYVGIVLMKCSIYALVLLFNLNISI
jgi:hypothetical protein